MPANPKYLTSSKWQRAAKITAAIPGGYGISLAFFVLLALWLPDHRPVLATLKYGLFILWTGLMLIPFLFKNGWKCLGLYLVLIVLLSAGIYFGKLYHPIV